MTESDFRVIQSKVLVGRIKDVLDLLVDSNQSAFIPNRQIGDNVLLAQELMRGYHRQRGSRRCAFKIDIQKAYDTMNWCFLEEILKRFGFHPCMISWLMKCISSASFTIRVNGDHHDFFPAKRGIRQGDPLSPYSFTLVMEVITLMSYQPVLKENVRDKVFWRSLSGSVGDFTVAAVWDENFLHLEDKRWANLVWFSQGVPRHAFILWLAIKERLRTMDRLLSWKRCGIAWREGVSGVYNLIRRMDGGANCWYALIEELSGVKPGNSIWSIIHMLLLAAGVYFLWQERNKRLHGEASRSAVVLVEQVYQLIQMELMGLKVKDGTQVRRAAMIWNLRVVNNGFVLNI
ncbi:hypothetical protein OSB04_018826 [Centaurea solstitialis]|uniref:Reverse transcriptase domain-containing protein n=1 Tax=Centaurea solstitialis TaxID=347529 RepID=A0AA38SPP7_9ASTR|nr:hypothetical protein OSB04_018826 [Centaurea solstitialis]